MVKIIANYSLNEQLGSGSYSTVYKAHHIITKQEVAVKKVSISKVKQYPKLEEYIDNEVNILTHIQQSPHIIQFHGMLKSAKNYYFIYQYCNQGTLETLLNQQIQGRFPIQQTLIYLKQILQAFKVLNGHHVMHRDLKPENIFIHNGILKLGDFGFCKHFEGDELSQTMLGSPIYMAPEVLKGQLYTSKADIWSLGVILYRMLYGACPFLSSSIAQLISLHNHVQLDLPKNAHNQLLNELLLKMLTKNPDERLQWDHIFNQYQITEQGQIYVKTVNPKVRKSFLELFKPPFLNKNQTSLQQPSIDQTNLSLSQTTLSQTNSQTTSQTALKCNNVEHHKSNGPLFHNVTQYLSTNYQPKRKTQIIANNIDQKNRMKCQMNRDKSKSGRGIEKSPLKNYNYKSRVDQLIKNHHKFIEINYMMTYFVKNHYNLDTIAIGLIISKNLFKDLQTLEKSLLKDQQNNCIETNIYMDFKNILELQITTMQEYNNIFQSLIKQFGMKIEQIYANKLNHLNNMLNRIQFDNGEDLVLGSQLGDYIYKDILIHRNTFQMIGKQQLARKLKSNYKLNEH